MTTWFSAIAIMPGLISLWHLSASQASWLTDAVRIGFIVGALGSSVVSLPDLVLLRKLMAISALLAVLANLTPPWMPSIAMLLVARFVTGIALAGIYPPALSSSPHVSNAAVASHSARSSTLLRSGPPRLT